MPAPKDRVTWSVSSPTSGVHRITWNLLPTPDNPRPRETRTYRGRRADAEALAAKHAEELMRGTVLAVTRDSLADYAERWLATIRRSPKTVSDYRSLLANHVLPFAPKGQPPLGSLPAAQVTPAHLDDLFNHLLARGRVDGRGGLSARTAVIIRAILHSMYDWGVRRRELAQNPVEAVEPIHAPKPTHVALPAPELARLLLLARSHRDFPLWATLAYTAMRPGEAAALKVSDVDWEAGAVRVNRWRARVAPSRWEEREVKTDGSLRLITVEPELLPILREQAERVAMWAREAGPAFVDQEYLFPAPDGSLQKATNIQKRWRVFVRANGFPERLRMYDLRHTQATILIESKEDPKTIAGRLGNSVRTVLETYAHPQHDTTASATFGRVVAEAAAAAEPRLALPGEPPEARAGRRMRYARQRAGYTVDELAGLAGMWAAEVSFFERGRAYRWREKLAVLAPLVGHDEEWFLGDREPEGCPARLEDMKGRVERKRAEPVAVGKRGSGMSKRYGRKD